MPLLSLSSTANADYTPISVIVTIPAGANRGCVFVPILDDDIVESTETVPLVGSFAGAAPFGVNFDPNNAVINIQDIDSKYQNF